MLDLPSWAGRQRVLLRGGNVYSPADPFASAMLVAGHEIAWIGGDGAALAMADGVEEVVELDGALVTPAFVDAWCAAARPALEPGLCLRRLPAPAPADGLPAAITSAAAGPVVTAATREEAAAAVRTAQTGAVLVLSALDIADVPALADSRLPVCLVPDSSGSLRDLPIAALAAAGVPLAFGSGTAPAHPWETIAAAVNHPDPDQRISARAAFAAHTRGGWRALGLPGRGVLVPGAAAHYAVWEVADLVVQAPDDRIEAWSTDPRSGTPGLPDMSPGAPRPRCLRTVVWGCVLDSQPAGGRSR